MTNVDITTSFKAAIEAIGIDAIKKIEVYIANDPVGCFMRKPMTIDYLLERIRSELD